MSSEDDQDVAGTIEKLTSLDSDTRLGDAVSALKDLGGGLAVMSMGAGEGKPAVGAVAIIRGEHTQRCIDALDAANEAGDRVEAVESGDTREGAYIEALEGLWGMVSDMVGSNRLAEWDVPDDYDALVTQMMKCGEKQGQR